MRVVFAGSSDFSRPSLRALATSRHPVIAVVTAPDRQGSRGRPAPRPVKELALELGLPLLQPERLHRDHVAPAVADGAELLVVCAYGQWVSPAVLETFPRGGVGVHPSLLPRHRGASPVAATILSGDPLTGVSVFQMERRLDAGPVLGSARLQIPASITKPELEDQLGDLAARLVPEVLDRMEQGRVEPVAQEETLATYAPKVTREDGHLHWELPATEIERRIRALQPWPGVTAELGGTRVKVLRGAAVLAPATVAPGAELRRERDSVIVGAGEGAVRLDLVQPPGGRPMTPAAYLRGRRQPPGRSR